MSTTENTVQHDCILLGHRAGCPNHPRRRDHRELEVSAHELAELDVIEVAIGSSRSHLTLAESERLRDQLSELLAADGTPEEPLPVTEAEAE